jgi:DnaJ-domain-containing protein 1
VNHYEVLGVAADSDPATIRRAYLDAARAHHPDFHTGADAATRAGHARRMQEVNEAWEVLGDPDARVDYDRALSRPADPGVARRAAREPEAPAGKGWTPRPGDDAWMSDFDGWAAETDELVAEPERTTADRVATLLPLVLAVVGAVLAVLALALRARPLVAGAFVCFVLAGGLFILLPMLAMSRGRGR